MGLSTAGDSYGECGIWRDQGPHPKEVEHDRAIYCESIDSGPLWAIGAEAGSLGFSDMEKTGGTWPSGGDEAGSGESGQGGEEERRRGGVGGDNKQELMTGVIT